MWCEYGLEPGHEQLPDTPDAGPVEIPLELPVLNVLSRVNVGLHLSPRLKVIVLPVGLTLAGFPGSVWKKRRR